MSRNLLWIANKGMAAPRGKPKWPAFLTLSLAERDAWNLHYALSHHLRQRAMDPSLTEPITVLVGGGSLDPDES